MFLALLFLDLCGIYLIAKLVDMILDKRAKAKAKVYPTSSFEESEDCPKMVQPIEENINHNPLDVEASDDQYNNNPQNEEIVSTVYFSIFSVYLLSAFTLRFLSERYLMNLHNDFPYLVTCFSLSVIYSLCLYAKNVRLRNYAVNTMFSK